MDLNEIIPNFNEGKLNILAKISDLKIFIYYQNT